jgi:cytochrome oxidase Cu insertion factor (SCO1/SenC/PrrC family)
MRALLFLVALVILIGIALVYTGTISLTQTRQAQAPAFDVSVKKVEVGTTTANVQVPTVGTRTKQVDVPTIRVGDSNSAAH